MEPPVRRLIPRSSHVTDRRAGSESIWRKVGQDQRFKRGGGRTSLGRRVFHEKAPSDKGFVLRFLSSFRPPRQRRLPPLSSVPQSSIRTRRGLAWSRCMVESVRPCAAI